MSFSHRAGLAPPRPVQRASMDGRLRNALWNAVLELLRQLEVSPLAFVQLASRGLSPPMILLERIWVDFRHAASDMFGYEPRLRRRAPPLNDLDRYGSDSHGLHTVRGASPPPPRAFTETGLWGFCSGPAIDSPCGGCGWATNGLPVVRRGTLAKELWVLAEQGLPRTRPSAAEPTLSAAR
jgi:hypothetical protein